MVDFIHRPFPSPSVLAEELATSLGQCLSAGGQGPFAVMLSGGKTPLTAYQRLQAAGHRASPLAHVLYSDERHVPPDSPESNYGLSRPLLNALGMDPDQVIRVRTELGLDEAAARYHNDLDGFLRRGGRIPLGLLGAGADGHTASLFSRQDAGRDQGLYAVSVFRDIKPDRVSVTPRLLKCVQRLVVLAIGPDKRDIVSRLLATPDQVVAGYVFRDLPQVEIWQA